MPLAPGVRLGWYEIVAPLGAGGMGEVYRARDTKLKRDVALKVLPDEFARDPERMARFQREAEVLASLSHPNIAQVYGVEDGALVMELVDGETLRTYVEKEPMEPDAAVALGIQIADALDAAHSKGIVHRDIKLGNIMISGRRHAKVLDFGLAKQEAAAAGSETLTIDALTSVGTVMGTPQYLAPELLQGSVANARSDLWAFGVVLYAMLSGRLPFVGSKTFEVVSAILKEPAPPLPSTVPRQLRAIVERCLEKRPEQRYQSAAEIRSALEDLRSGSGGTASAPAGRYWFWAIGAAAALLVVIFAWQMMHRIVRAPEVIAHELPNGGKPSANQEANDDFALAMQFQQIQNDIPRAQQMLERALALDPHFGSALRYHAFNYVIQTLNGFLNDPSVIYKAEEELRQASREEPGLASIHSAQAAVYMMQGRKELAPAELDRTLQLRPLDREAILWRVIYQWLGEENEPAKAAVRTQLEKEPLFGPARMFLGEILRTEGDVQGAIREQQKVLAQGPGNMSALRWLVLAYMDGGELEKARKLLEDKRAAFSKNYMWRQTWSLWLAAEGKHDEARRALDDETLKFTAEAFVVTLDAAEFYALQGDHPKAIEWLDRAVRNGDERVNWFQKDPRLANIRQDERFKQVVASIEARRKRRDGK